MSRTWSAGVASKHYESNHESSTYLLKNFSCSLNSLPFVLSNERGQILLKNLLIVGEGEDGHTLLIHTEGLFKQLVFL